jgi:hypothetical protein
MVLLLSVVASEGWSIILGFHRGSTTQRVPVNVFLVFIRSFVLKSFVDVVVYISIPASEKEWGVLPLFITLSTNMIIFFRLFFQTFVNNATLSVLSTTVSSSIYSIQDIVSAIVTNCYNCHCNVYISTSESTNIGSGLISLSCEHVDDAHQENNVHDVQ